MKTAVFYENLWEGAQAAGRTVEDVLTQMHAEGMDKLYLSVDSWKRDREMLRPSWRSSACRSRGCTASAISPGSRIPLITGK